MRERYWLAGSIAFLLYYLSTRTAKSTVVDSSVLKSKNDIKSLGVGDILEDIEDKDIQTGIEMSEAPAVDYVGVENAQVEELSSVDIEPEKPTGITTKGETVETVIKKEDVKNRIHLIDERSSDILYSPGIRVPRLKIPRLGVIKDKIKGIFVRKEVCNNEAIIYKLDELGQKFDCLNSEKKKSEPVVVNPSVDNVVSPVVDSPNGSDGKIRKDIELDTADIKPNHPNYNGGDLYTPGMPTDGGERIVDKFAFQRKISDVILKIDDIVWDYRPYRIYDEEGKLNAFYGRNNARFRFQLVPDEDVFLDFLNELSRERISVENIIPELYKIGAKKEVEFLLSYTHYNHQIFEVVGELLGDMIESNEDLADLRIKYKHNPNYPNVPAMRVYSVDDFLLGKK